MSRAGNTPYYKSRGKSKQKIKRRDSRGSRNRDKAKRRAKPSAADVRKEARKIVARFLAQSGDRKGKRRDRMRSDPFGNKLVRKRSDGKYRAVVGQREVMRLGATQALNFAKEARARLREEQAENRPIRFADAPDMQQRDLARIEYIERIAGEERDKQRAYENEQSIRNRGGIAYRLISPFRKSDTPARIFMFAGIFVAVVVLFRFIFMPLFHV
jgi:hypothetical protein